MNTAFIKELSAELKHEAEAIEDLSTRLASLESEGAEAWPGISLPEDYFLLALARRARKSPPKKGLAQWLDHVQPADLHLALGCELLADGAIPAFERAYKKDLDKLIRRYEGPDLPAEDLTQALREKLFVSTPTRAAKISSYSGQGFLQNWVRVTCARTFIDMLRSSSKKTSEEILSGSDERLMEAASSGADLELEFMKREYRAHFKEAFAVAAKTLSSHERNLIRQHLVFKLSVQQLGALYDVHGSTISRRISKTREKLFAELRQAFMARLNIDRDEFESILFMIRSRLDVSMPRVLETSLG